MSPTHETLMVTVLREAWPNLPPGLDTVVQESWRATARATNGQPSDAVAVEIKNFTRPLALLAHRAGFHHDAQGRTFVNAVIAAAQIDDPFQESVRESFAETLDAAARGEFSG